MKIAIVGLGKMGMQIAQKLLENGHAVIANSTNPQHTAEAGALGATLALQKSDVVNAFNKDEQVVLWLMIPSEAVDEALLQWVAVLPPNSIIIDGGNSDYRLTKQRSEKLAAVNITLLDSGTSGGIHGYKNGFSMMVGGDSNVFTFVEPVFKTLAAPSGMYQHFGPSGAGHFVKMVHNGIEYGMMQSLAEGYQVLKQGPYPDLNLGQVGEVWQHGSVVTSWLNELTRDVLQEDQELTGVDGFVAESGEARWTLETAKDMGIALPAIQAAFDVRLASQKGEVSYATKLLAAMRNKFGGHTVNKS